VVLGFASPSGGGDKVRDGQKWEDQAGCWGKWKSPSAELCPYDPFPVWAVVMVGGYLLLMSHAEPVLKRRWANAYAYPLLGCRDHFIGLHIVANSWNIVPCFSGLSVVAVGVRWLGASLVISVRIRSHPEKKKKIWGGGCEADRG
jgi:hypothetical protein